MHESWYDIESDWELIEASFAKQYGIRLRLSGADMPYDEFVSLLVGLMADTPLGQIVSIRSEQDAKAIKAFNSDQKKIHREWRNRNAKMLEQSPEQLAQSFEQLTKQMLAMFGQKQGR